MSDGEDQRGSYRERAIGDGSQLVVNDGRTGNQQCQTDRATKQYTDVAVAPVTERERQQADRQYDNQHLQVKMITIAVSQAGKRQESYEKRQRQAMQQAQPGQRNGAAVQRGIRLGLAVIHERLP